MVDFFCDFLFSTGLSKKRIGKSIRNKYSVELSFICLNSM